MADDYESGLDTGDTSCDVDMPNDTSSDIEASSDCSDTTVDLSADGDLSDDGSDALPDGDNDFADNIDTPEETNVKSSDDTENTGDNSELQEDGDNRLNKNIFDENGNLKIMNSEEYLSLSPKEQELFAQKLDSLSEDEQNLYAINYAKADLDNYNRKVANGECNKDETIERDIQDVFDGKYMGKSDELDPFVSENCAKGMAYAVTNTINLDPIAASSFVNQAGDMGRLFGPTIMRDITNTAYLQSYPHAPTPILVHSDELGNKTYEFGLTKDSSEIDWDNRITDYIDNDMQMDIYKNANLSQSEINGRPCLIKDIDLDFIDEKTGLTNRELMAKGRSPIDAATNEKIELHHMGQEFESPFAELTENSEHGDGNHKILHPKTSDSWRNDENLKKEYQREKCNHWIARSKEY